VRIASGALYELPANYKTKRRQNAVKTALGVACGEWVVCELPCDLSALQITYGRSIVSLPAAVNSARSVSTGHSGP
jgi:hypothetical protein